MTDHAHSGGSGGWISLYRVGTMILRYWYIIRRSWPRLFELAYWPLVQMILWGFISQFFATHSSWVATAAGVLIGAVMLWDTLFRGEIGVSVSFLEEMWSRNLAQLFVSPLRAHEFVLALMAMSTVRTIIGVAPAMVLAIPLYEFNIFSLGVPLIGFFANLLVMGWSVGLLVSALILRWGLGAESLAWFVIFAVAPLSGIYYPISTLPDWLEPVAWALPSSYVFEGMRGVLIEHRFDFGLFASAVALNVFYIVLASVVFLYTIHAARREGLLLQQGE
ncbi:MAG: ABC transporter permease [Alphaproteobacteria bacterium]|nr:ABC transporter permease [Alphaproteobacteria bacterium]